MPYRTSGYWSSYFAPTYFESVGAAPAVLPDDLVEAVQAHYRAVPAVPLAGGLWIDEAPPRSLFPVAVLDDLNRIRAAELIEDRPRRSVVIDGRLQLRVHAAGRNQARTLGRTLARSFELAADSGSLLFHEGRLLDLRRSGLEVTALDPEPGPDGAPVWQHLIEFVYTLIEVEA